MSDLRYFGQLQHVLVLRTLSVSTGSPDSVMVLTSNSLTAGAFTEVSAGIVSASVDPGTLSVRSWSMGAGKWSVDVACEDTARRVLLRTLYRGRSVGLFVRFLDAPTSTELLIASGRVENVLGMAPQVTIMVADVVSSLRHARWDGSAFAGASSGQLFGRLSETTVDTTSYSISATTITVADSSGFEVCDSEAGHGSDLLEVEDNSGNRFYLLWTSEAANVITLDSAVTSAGSDQDCYDTDRASAGTGNAVYERHLLWYEPWDIARKVITSTGAGTNGSWDTLILDCGMGVPSAQVASGGGVVGWDEADDYVYTSVGGYELDVIVSDVVLNPLSWMSEWLSPLGLILVQSGGKVDMRTVWDPVKAPSAIVRCHITDADIVEVTTWQAHDSATDVHYFVFDAINGRDEVGATDANFSPDDTRFPMRRSQKNICEWMWHKRTYGYYYESSAGSVDGYSSLVSNEVVDRLGRFYWDSPEYIALTCTGGGAKRIAALVPGDIIELTTSRTTPRPRLGDDDTYDQRRALVLQARVNWPGGGALPTVDLRLSVLPENYSDPTS